MLDDCEPVDVAWSEFLAFEDLRITQNPVQWRPKFVAHVREKVTLCLVGRVRAFLGNGQLCRSFADHVFEVLSIAPQFLLSMLVLSDVT